jgi:2-polyprenyl-3-methyl-5-hydroxy-6-metoxy-1,4-benzoquinol methylase
MESNAFVAEVYRRMSLRQAQSLPRETWEDMQRDTTVMQAQYEYASMLPGDKKAPILDIGFGRGWFLAACLNLGYTNLAGADFGIAHKSNVASWSPCITLHEIKTSIADFLGERAEAYAFIHLSHVIEHIPKHCLLHAVDALYWSLQRGGRLVVRTPNMEGPCANSSLYVTLAHEYGFSGSNLKSLLHICGFDDIHFHRFRTHDPTMKQRIGELARRPVLGCNRVLHRLFGVNQGGQFGPELVVSGRRGSSEPLFDSKFK